MGTKLTQMSRYELADFRWVALGEGDKELYAACEAELERRDIEDGALVLLAA
ncbi:hypothetical protein KP001_14405 [Geomonas subterranea]|uniref:Uncharacterized protein n=1 Tax=Geomonas subterranea TaxID=2847989 RepID=A0ABX8LJ92_9BACT|nr:hypothetical protein [Geomonas subterranea]QXE89625.1 hypothetical protein KP001_14405 [Geomonas subterranea]QXM08259.1 hypothetical protein KP002_14875 [Geomonas subterranea]